MRTVTVGVMAARLAGFGGARLGGSFDLVRLVGDQLSADERRASTIAAYEPMVVPALLRTPEYARALGHEPAHDVLSRPVRGLFFLHEAALHAAVADGRVMAEQLHALVLWNAHEHLSVRLVPFSAGARPGTAVGFEYLEFPDAAPVAYVDGRPAPVAGRVQALLDLGRVALSAAESSVEFTRWAQRHPVAG